MRIVYELPPHQFSRVMPFFIDPPFDEMFINPALDRRQPARVFVDNAETPRSAMLCCPFEFYLAGDPNASDMRRFIHDAPAEVTEFRHFHGFAPLNPAWIPILDSDFAGKLMVLPRINFRLSESSLRRPRNWPANLPDYMHLVPITAALARRIDAELGENIGFLWSGYDQFAANSYGWCLMVNDQIASIAVAAGFDGRSASISVLTEPEFRGRGFSPLVCKAFIDDSLTRGLIPVWECEVRNTNSNRVAEKLGFVERNRFTQLSIADPPYGPLELSHGVWQVEAGNDGLIIWRRDD